jgi:hypothetical protein
LNRPIFLAAAAYNVLGGGACLVAPGPTQHLLLGEPLTGFAAMLWTDLWIFVVIIGLGNALVAIDPARNRGIAVVGALGKAAIGLHWLAVVASGRATTVLAGGACGDLVFSVLFSVWLVRSRPARGRL